VRVAEAAVDLDLSLAVMAHVAWTPLTNAIQLSSR